MQQGSKNNDPPVACLVSPESPQQYVVLPGADGVASFQLTEANTVPAASLGASIFARVSALTSVSGKMAAVLMNNGFRIVDLETGETLLARLLEFRAEQIVLRGDVVVIGGRDRVVMQSLTNERRQISIPLSAPLGALRLGPRFLQIRYAVEADPGGASCMAPRTLDHRPAAADLELTEPTLLAAWHDERRISAPPKEGERLGLGFVSFDRSEQLVAKLWKVPAGAFSSSAVSLEVKHAVTGEWGLTQQWEDSRGIVDLVDPTSNVEQAPAVPTQVAVVGRTVFRIDDRAELYGARVEEFVTPTVEPVSVPKAEAEKVSWWKRLLGGHPQRRSPANFPQTAASKSPEFWADALAKQAAANRVTWTPINLPFDGAALDIITVENPQRAYIVTAVGATGERVRGWVRVSPSDFSILEVDDALAR